MFFQNHYHINELFTKELFEIYFLIAMRKLAVAMVGLFLPLYLLIEVGFPFSKVVIFFLFMFLSMTVMLFPTMVIVSRLGSKHSIIFSMPPLILGMVLAIFIPQYNFLYWIVAVLMGIELAMFWVGVHVDTAVNAKKKLLGKESAVIWFSNVVGIVAGPILGGLILRYTSFAVLFVVAVIILIIAGIPLLFSKEVYGKLDFNWKYFFHDGHRKYFFAYFAQGARATTIAVFWPIFIFTILGSYLSIGIYGTVATIFMVIFGYFIGQKSDQTSKSLIIKFAGAIDGIIWIFRVFITTVLEVFTLGTVGAITATGIDIPLLAKSYGRAKKEKIAGFILFRELSIRAGQFSILLIALYFGTVQSTFVFTAFASLLYFFL